MDVLTTNDVRDLASIENGLCVSIYMPTHPTGREGQQDAVRLKNLVTDAEQQLIERGMRGVEARGLLKPVAKLLHDRKAWGQRKEGLAIFRSGDAFINYWLAVPVSETVIVGRRFYVKPLLPAVTDSPRFYVLAISRNRPRLLKAAWNGVENLRPTDFPVNIEVALNLQTADRGEQVHSGMRGDLGKEAGVFHGQGGHRDTLKEESAAYYRMIDNSMRAVLRDSPLPLILAGVDYELAAFRKVSKCADIMEEILCGSFDYVDDNALCKQALPIAQRYYSAERRQALAKYRTLAGTGLSSDHVDTIVSAAHQGRIDALFAEIRADLFGRYFPDTACVEKMGTQADPEFDLIEQVIAQTLRHDGTAYAATPNELPHGKPMCAIFRY